MIDAKAIPTAPADPARPVTRHSTTLKCLAGAALGALLAGQMLAASPPAAYPAMAPLDQYLMPRDAEIALARSAGPASVTGDAEVLVLGPHGYETAVPGHNGFVCAVERSWAAPLDDREFWNPKLRSPNCWNAAAARYFIPRMIRKTELVLAGKSTAEIAAGLRAAIASGEIPALGPGGMCFMMSKAGNLNDKAGHWHPHLMFFSHEGPAVWGANQPGSPVLAITDSLDHVTTFLVPVHQWSDGTADDHSH